MRRLEAMFNERRKSVSNSRTVGKTEKSTALRTCTADRKTSTAAAIDSPSSKSSTSDGSGTNITNPMRLPAPGNANSRAVISHRAQAGRPALFFVGAPPGELPAGAVNTADELIGPPEWWQPRRQPQAYSGAERRWPNV